jgi:hypothetical protein
MNTISFPVYIHGSLSWLQVMFIFLFVAYIMQLLIIYVLLLIDNNFESKKQFLFYHIPILPVVDIIIKEINRIGK